MRKTSPLTGNVPPSEANKIPFLLTACSKYNIFPNSSIKKVISKLLDALLKSRGKRKSLNTVADNRPELNRNRNDCFKGITCVITYSFNPNHRENVQCNDNGRHTP